VHKERVFAADISGGFIIFLEVEPFLRELVTHEIADDHALVPVGNVAFVADVRSSQGVVSRDHHAVDLRSLQSSYRALRLLLQLVLEHFEPIEVQVLFSFFS
jgi:hypothetical protein